MRHTTIALSRLRHNCARELVSPRGLHCQKPNSKLSRSGLSSVTIVISAIPLFLSKRPTRVLRTEGPQNVGHARRGFTKTKRLQLHTPEFQRYTASNQTMTYPKRVSCDPPSYLCPLVPVIGVHGMTLMSLIPGTKSLHPGHATLIFFHLIWKTLVGHLYTLRHPMYRRNPYSP